MFATLNKLIMRNEFSYIGAFWRTFFFVYVVYLRYMLTVQRRHRKPCKRSTWDAGYTKCTCPIVIRGMLNGKRVSTSTLKYLPKKDQRNIEKATALAQLWDRSGAVVFPDDTWQAPVTQIAAGGSSGQMTIAAAVDAFINHGEDTGNGDAVLYKKKNVFREGKQSLLVFANDKGMRFVSEINFPMLREWRSTWLVEALSRHKRQCSAIGFLWFCERNGWLPQNFAHQLTRALGKIKVPKRQTGYFPAEDYKKIVDATYAYSDRPSIDKLSGGTLGGERIRALTELMRWTGLRIRDAVTLERRRLSTDPTTGLYSVMIRQKKTGDWVYCPIPPHVVTMLRTVPPGPKQIAGGPYFFWTGNGLPKTLVSNWERSYAKLFTLAGLREVNDVTGKKNPAHPHMLRDTFAVESLLSGMRIENVQELLGHASVKTTEENYMPWVRARQTSLNKAVVDSWVAQGIVTVAKSGLQVVGRRKAG